MNTLNEQGMIAHIDSLADQAKLRELALQAIAAINLDVDHDWHQLAVLLVTIARVELTTDYDGMMHHVNTAIVKAKE